jgi:hypothetical protein
MKHRTYINIFHCYGAVTQGLFIGLDTCVKYMHLCCGFTKGLFMQLEACVKSLVPVL